MIGSRTPIVVLQTVEEERARRIVEGMAHGTNVPLFIWTAIQGFWRHGLKNNMYHTQEPMAALTTIGDSNFDAIYLLKGFHRYLENPVVVRKLQDISAEFRQRQRSIIILAPKSDLPVELSVCAVVMPLELPSVDEIKKLLTRVIHDETERSDQRRAWAHSMNSPVRVEPREDKRTGSASDLESDDLEQFAKGLGGLTLFEAEQALAGIFR